MDNVIATQNEEKGKQSHTRNKIASVAKSALAMTAI